MGQRVLISNEYAVEAFPLPTILFPFQCKTKYINRLGSILVLTLAQEEYEIWIVPNEIDKYDQRYNE